MIKVSHVHENGKVCFVSTSILKNIEPIVIDGNIFAVEYKPYTGHFYIYDTQTGKEVATITRDFYNIIKIFKSGEFAIDPTCKK